MFHWFVTKHIEFCDCNVKKFKMWDDLLHTVIVQTDFFMICNIETNQEMRHTVIFYLFPSFLPTFLNRKILFWKFISALFHFLAHFSFYAPLCATSKQVPNFYKSKMKNMLNKWKGETHTHKKNQSKQEEKWDPNLRWQPAREDEDIFLRLQTLCGPMCLLFNPWKKYPCYLGMTVSKTL